MRIAILGNAGGGNSTIARRIAAEHALPCIEIDTFLWRPDWVLAPEKVYRARHAEAVAGDAWVIEGLGMRDSIGPRVERATVVVLVDLPLWQHFWLAAERQIAWAAGGIPHPPGDQAEGPPTRRLFETMGAVDRDWMPKIRDEVARAERAGKAVYRITDADDLEAFRL